LFLVFNLVVFSKTQIFYQCDFEEQCNDFVFDSHWIVKNISSHMDHTYMNLSGHYISYTDDSNSTPVTIYHTRSWVDPPKNMTACITQWYYLQPGSFDFDIELAQGDDLQARLYAGRIGASMNQSQWVGGGQVELPYASHHYVPHIIFADIAGSVDFDDLSVFPCLPTTPIPPTITTFECDFDQNLCPELISLGNYSYSWSSIQAEEAQNYTSTAPAVDHSVGDKTGIL